MNSYCMVYKLKEDRIEDYISCHKSISQEQVQALKDAGAEDLEIYLWDSYSVITYKCEDFGAFIDRLALSPLNSKWQEIVGPMFDTQPQFSGDEKIEPLSRIFKLSDF